MSSLDLISMFDIGRNRPCRFSECRIAPCKKVRVSTGSSSNESIQIARLIPVSYGQWSASQKLIADCEELIALLTPTKIKLVTECVANNSTMGLGVAADFRIADRIIENGGEASLLHLARVCQTDEHKLGCVMHMLCQRHIFVEVAPDVFRNNRHSYELRAETGAAEMMLIE